jgi:hypothetical protein
MGCSMRLVIVDDDGRVIDVVDDIEDYDLSRPLAAAEIIHELKSTLDRIQSAQTE